MKGSALAIARVMMVAMFLVPPAAEAAGRAVTFRAMDGRTVNAQLFEAGQRPAPAIVLVPMLGRGREDWQAMGERLAEAGITALSIDLPGLGYPGDAQSLAAWHTDVIAAVAFLASRPDVRPSSVGVAGASLGGSLAALAGAADTRIRAVALVSPSLDYRGVRIESAMQRFGRPALLVASTRDPYAARSARELAQQTAGLAELRWSDVTAHGTVLLSRDPDLGTALVEWFRRTLG